jgi:hypothetical protein
MKLIKVLGTGLCFTVLCFLVAPKAKADDSNQKTTVTLTDPVEVPGVGQHLLQPGTYVFKLKDSTADRHVVEIYNQDESKLLTTLLSVPNNRLKTTTNPVLTFKDRPNGEPQALKAWFHSGSPAGEQFVWDRPKAIQLAKESNEAVLSTPTAVATSSVDGLTTAQLEAVSPSGETVATTTMIDAPAAEVAVTAPMPVVAPNPVNPAAPVPDAVAAPPVPAQEAAVTPSAPVPDAVVTPPAPVQEAVVTPPAPAQDAVSTSAPTPDAVVTPPAPIQDAAVTRPAPVQDTVVPPPPPVQEASAAPAPVVAPEPAVAPSLPQTGSHLPLIGLLGLLTLGAGFGLLGLSKMTA